MFQFGQDLHEQMESIQKTEQATDVLEIIFARLKASPVIGVIRGTYDDYGYINEERSENLFENDSFEEGQILLFHEWAVDLIEPNMSTIESVFSFVRKLISMQISLVDLYGAQETDVKLLIELYKKTLTHLKQVTKPYFKDLGYC